MLRICLRRLGYLDLDLSFDILVSIHSQIKTILNIKN